MDFQLSCAFSQQLACPVVVQVDAVCVFENTVGKHIVFIGSEMNDA